LAGAGCSVISLKKFFSVPASLCGKPAGRLGEGISRREFRRNLPFLPGPCQAFFRILTNQIGDDPYSFTLPNVKAAFQLLIHLENTFFMDLLGLFTGFDPGRRWREVPRSKDFSPPAEEISAPANDHSFSFHFRKKILLYTTQSYGIMQI
jgi:hypothetical protein